METLRLTSGRGHGLDRGSRNIVEYILCGEAPAACLGMGAQGKRARILWIKVLAQKLGPQQPRGALFRNLHEVVHARAPEERQTRSKGVHVHSGRDAGAHIFDAVGECVTELQVQGGPGFLHVITGDRNAVELRHLLCEA